MRKLHTVLLVLCMLFTLFGCSNSKSDEQKGEDSSNIITIKPHQNLVISQLPYSKDWLKTDLSAVGLKNVSAEEKVKGRFSESDSSAGSRYAYLLNDYERYYFGLYHDSYLAIETDTKILFKDLSTDNLSGSYSHEIHACDVCGDKTDEIILHQVVGMTGGAGQYLSRIFKVVGGEIREIFNSRQESQYDTGFSSALKDGFGLEIKNKFTGYSTILDFSAYKVYHGVYFDETGKPLNKNEENVLFDSFREFTPADVDGDGTFELVCFQYSSLYGHSDYIGDAKSILKFNSDTKNFEVIEAEFIFTKN